MRHYKLINNFAASLAAPIDPTDTEIVLDDAKGLFNDASDSVRYRLTLFETQETDGVLVELRREVMDVIGGINNTLTVERGDDADTWAAADVEARLTAEVVDQINANITATLPETVTHEQWLSRPSDDERVYSVVPDDPTVSVTTTTITAQDLDPEEALNTDAYNVFTSHLMTGDIGA